MLAAEFALAVAPAAVGDDRGEAFVDAAGINRDRAAEARADDADALRIDVGMAGEKRHRARGVLDLFETDDAPELALALAAAAHVEAQRDVAEIVQHLRGLHHVARVLVAAEPVQHEECGAPLAAADAVGHAHHAGQLEPG